MTLDAYRAFLRRLDPTEAQDDVRWAIDTARRYHDLPRHVSAKTRAAVADEMIANTLLAVRSAWNAGAALVVSAATRAASERIASARSFGKAIARERMRAAGFAPADYEVTLADIDDMVRAEVRRAMQRAELWELIDDDFK